MIARFATNTKTPQYRERVPYGQAIVMLTDAVTRQRKDYWLGEMNSPPSREMYHRLIAEWEASGRRLPAPTDVPKPAIHHVSVSEIILKYKQFVDVSYKPAIETNISAQSQAGMQFCLGNC